MAGCNSKPPPGGANPPGGQQTANDPPAAWPRMSAHPAPPDPRKLGALPAAGKDAKRSAIEVDVTLAPPSGWQSITPRPPARLQYYLAADECLPPNVSVVVGADDGTPLEKVPAIYNETMPKAFPGWKAVEISDETIDGQKFCRIAGSCTVNHEKLFGVWYVARWRNAQVVTVTYTFPESRYAELKAAIDRSIQTIRLWEAGVPTALPVPQTLPAKKSLPPAKSE
jgi:hypothetical protein